jgi:hypothetical protein
MRTDKERSATGAQIARTAFSIDRMSPEELLARGYAIRPLTPVPDHVLKREAWAQEGLMYAIQAGGIAQPVKVGYTTADGLSGRLYDLQIANPYRLTILAQAPAKLSQEQRAHKALASDRLSGEWFGWSPRVAAFVRALKVDGAEAAIAAAKAAKDRPR